MAKLALKKLQYHYFTDHKTFPVTMHLNNNNAYVSVNSIFSLYCQKRETTLNRYYLIVIMYRGQDTNFSLHREFINGFCSYGW